MKKILLISLIILSGLVSAQDKVVLSLEADTISCASNWNYTCGSTSAYQNLPYDRIQFIIKFLTGNTSGYAVNKPVRLNFHNLGWKMIYTLGGDTCKGSEIKNGDLFLLNPFLDGYKLVRGSGTDSISRYLHLSGVGISLDSTSGVYTIGFGNIGSDMLIIKTTTYTDGELWMNNGSVSIGDVGGDGNGTGIAVVDTVQRITLIADSVVIDAPIQKWNNIKYTVPTVQGAANTILKNNGSGVMSWVSTPCCTQPDTTFVPANKDTVVLKTGYYNVIQPVAGIDTLTLRFPSSPTDGEFLEIKCTQIIGIYPVPTIGGTYYAPLAGVLSLGKGTWIKVKAKSNVWR